MLNTERHREMSRLIRERRRATVGELSQRFAVSPATVRRDLDVLMTEGLIVRAHGGAVAVERSAPEPPVLQRVVEHAEEKRRIGQAAARLVHDGETIFLGSGTTTVEVARALLHRVNLTVITNALNVANALVEDPQISVVVVGGLLRHTELSVVGHFTEMALTELHANKVIMGMRAISLEHGLTNDYVLETMTDRAIIHSAPQVILVVDHTKFGAVSTAMVAPITAVHTIVTDSAAPADMVAELKRRGIEVIVATDEGQ